MVGFYLCPSRITSCSLVSVKFGWQEGLLRVRVARSCIDRAVGPAVIQLAGSLPGGLNVS